jgi:hypothetical protein
MYRDVLCKMLALILSRYSFVAALDNNFLKDVWVDVVADRDALCTALVSDEDALSTTTTNTPFGEDNAFPLPVLDARLTVATARSSLLAIETRTTALFETATAPASTSHQDHDASSKRSSDDVDHDDRKGKHPFALLGGRALRIRLRAP